MASYSATFFATLALLCAFGQVAADCPAGQELSSLFNSTNTTMNIDNFCVECSGNAVSEDDTDVCVECPAHALANDDFTACDCDDGETFEFLEDGSAECIEDAEDDTVVDDTGAYDIEVIIESGISLGGTQEELEEIFGTEVDDENPGQIAFKETIADLLTDFGVEAEDVIIIEICYGGCSDRRLRSLLTDTTVEIIYEVTINLAEAQEASGEDNLTVEDLEEDVEEDIVHAVEEDQSEEDSFLSILTVELEAEGVDVPAGLEVPEQELEFETEVEYSEASADGSADDASTTTTLAVSLSIGLVCLALGAAVYMHDKKQDEQGSDEPAATQKYGTTGADVELTEGTAATSLKATHKREESQLSVQRQSETTI